MGASARVSRTKAGPRLYVRLRRLLALLEALGGNVGNLDFQKLLFLYCQELKSADPTGRDTSPYESVRVRTSPYESVRVRTSPYESVRVRTSSCPTDMAPFRSPVMPTAAVSSITVCWSTTTIGGC